MSGPLVPWTDAWARTPTSTGGSSGPRQPSPPGVRGARSETAETPAWRWRARAERWFQSGRLFAYEIQDGLRRHFRDLECPGAEHRLDEQIGVAQILGSRSRHQSSDVLEMRVET